MLSDLSELNNSAWTRIVVLGLYKLEIFSILTPSVVNSVFGVFWAGYYVHENKKRHPQCWLLLGLGMYLGTTPIERDSTFSGNESSVISVIGASQCTQEELSYVTVSYRVPMEVVDPDIKAHTNWAWVTLRDPKHPKQAHHLFPMRVLHQTEVHSLNSAEFTDCRKSQKL